jgi:hypothetical protein
MIAARKEAYRQALATAQAELDAVPKDDREARKQALFKRRQARAALHFYEKERSRQELKALITFVQKWAQSKMTNREGCRTRNRRLRSARSLRYLSQSPYPGAPLASAAPFSSRVLSAPYFDSHVDPCAEPVNDRHQAVDSGAVEISIADAREVCGRDPGAVLGGPHAAEVRHQK